jgi:hypothetical protein
MRPFIDPEIQAFHDLRARLTRRRLQQLEPRLRLELALLALLLTGFVFWQVRGPLASLRLHGGPRPVLMALGSAEVILAALAAAAVGVRHARRLRVGPPGPPWLSLPAGERALARHLAWDSGGLVAWVGPLAAGVWGAAFGLAPWPWLVVLALLWVALLRGAAEVGARLGQWLAGWRVPLQPPNPALTRILAGAGSRGGARRLAPARWRSKPPWVALCAKDLRVTLRVGALGRQLGAALLFWVFSAAAWRLPAPEHARDLSYVAAFVLALLGSAALGEWLVALSGSDPFAVVRSLPVGVMTVWGARFAWAALATFALLATHALAASGLSPHALRLFLAWLGAATLAIAALAVNYGVTLFPRADVAQRLLGLSLGLAVAASLMIPMLGWAVLASAVLHSARRLPHWARLEEA